MSHAPSRIRAFAGRWRHRARLWPLFAVVVLLLLWPAVMLAVGAFRTAPPGSPGGWSSNALATVASMSNIAKAAGNSLFLAVMTTAFALVLAPVFAFLSQRSDLAWRRAITPMMMVVFATPPLFYAMAYSLLGNRFNGYANAMLAAWLGQGSIVFDVESWAGVMGVTTLRATAFIYLFIVPAFRALDPTHEDASLVSGRGRLATFVRISLPILLPAFSGAAILGFIAGLHSFDTPLVLGEPAGIRVIATEIYDLLVHAYPPAYAEASLISLVLVALVGLLCAVQTLVMGRRSYVTVGGKHAGQRLQALRRWRWPAGVFVAAYGVLGLAAPFFALVYGALQPFPGVHGTLSLLHFTRVFARPGIAQSVGTTLLLSVGVGTLAMVFAVLLALVSQQSGRRTRGFLRFATMVPYAMPGIVAALAVTWAYVSLPGLRQIYGTAWMLVLAFMVVVMPFAMQSAQAAIAQVSPDLNAAARVAGASAPRATLQIVGRLILPSFFTGWFFVSIMIAGNLDVPLLLGTPTLSTIASQIYILQSQGQIGDATALLVSSMAGAIGLGLACRGVLAGLQARAPHRPATRRAHGAPPIRRQLSRETT